MKPIELLKETYKKYLNTEGEPQSWENFVRYSSTKKFAIDCNLTTVEELNNLETKALIEWENSLTENAQ